MTRILKWDRKAYWFPIIQIINASIWLIIFSFPKGTVFTFFSFLFWPWLIIGLTCCYALVYMLIAPELEVTPDSIKLHRYRLTLLIKRDSLPIKDIASIIESTRKAYGVSKMTNIPTFIIKMKDGKEYEYFPRTKSGQRLDEIKTFFSSCSALPNIIKAENTI